MQHDQQRATPAPGDSRSPANLQRKHNFRRNALTAAIARAILGSTVLLSATVMPQLAVAQVATPSRSYHIAAGALEDVLNRFGREAGILLSFTSDTTAGLRSPGLQGNYSIADALETLLTGSGLRASRQANGSYLLSKRSTDAANGKGYCRPLPYSTAPHAKPPPAGSTAIPPDAVPLLPKPTLHCWKRRNRFQSSARAKWKTAE